ncbi:MAG: DUF58 domain-containing protein [Bacteroidales bacterium]|nr:DUF58 domain-containing protein [Bacteroidales bacterium]
MIHLDRNKISSLSNIELLARQVVEGFITGLHKSPFHGFSVEFAEHRQYNTGESTRHLDWKLYAKTERLYVKRYEEETNLRCRILIDRSPSMYFPYNHSSDFENPDKITFSIYAAAAIMEMLRRQRDAVGLSLFDSEIKLHSPAKSNYRHIQLLYSYLENLLEKPKPAKNEFTDVASTFHQIANTIHKRSLVVIFSDMFDNNNPDELINALRHLKYNKHEIILFHVTDARLEVSFEFGSRPYKFVDLESGETLKLNPKDVKNQYSTSMKEYRDLLKLKCGQYKIDFVEVDINKGIKEVLLPYFLKRQKLY